MSSDGCGFRVDVSRLYNDSSVFAVMLDIPLPNDSVCEIPPREEEVQLAEDSLMLGFLSSFFSCDGTVCSAWCTVGVLTAALVCADKYGIYDLPVFVRGFVAAYWEVLARDAIGLYGFVRELGWDEFVWRASRETLKLNIDNPAVRSQVEGQLKPLALAQLRSFHDSRKTALHHLVQELFLHVQPIQAANPPVRMWSYDCAQHHLHAVGGPGQDPVSYQQSAARKSGVENGNMVNGSSPPCQKYDKMPMNCKGVLCYFI